MRIRQSSRVGGVGFLALVATYGIGRMAYGLFVPRFQEDFSLSLEALGFYASGAQTGYLLATVATGVLTARFGPRVPVLSGCLLLTVGAVLVASAQNATILALGVIFAGTSAGGTWAPFSDAVDRQVPTVEIRRALALVNAGTPVGLVVVGVLVIASGRDWRIAWWGFAAIGLVAAAASWRVLVPRAVGRLSGDGWPRLRWFLNPRSSRMLVVAFGMSVTCGAYFVFAPASAQNAGLASWVGPAMWLALGIAGAGIGVFAGSIANRYEVGRPLAVMLVLISGSPVVMVAAPASPVAALGSAALFGIGFTTGFALIVMWSQKTFHDRPTTGFTLAIVLIAAGFMIGPSMFGVIATSVGRPIALLVTSLPALLVAPVAFSCRGCLDR